LVVNCHAPWFVVCYRYTTFVSRFSSSGSPGVLFSPAVHTGSSKIDFTEMSFRHLVSLELLIAHADKCLDCLVSLAQFGISTQQRVPSDFVGRLFALAHIDRVYGSCFCSVIEQYVEGLICVLLGYYGKSVLGIDLKVVQIETMYDLSGHNIKISYFDVCDGLTDGGVESFRILDCSLATLEQNSMGILVGLEIVVDKRVVNTKSCLEVAGFDSVEHNNVAQLNVKLDANVRQVLDQSKTNAEAVRLISCLPKNCSTATLELIRADISSIRHGVQKCV
ncbi:hypothetical protein KCU83_g195, partial [Aureobasidium melanogenum]